MKKKRNWAPEKRAAQAARCAVMMRRLHADPAFAKRHAERAAATLGRIRNTPEFEAKRLAGIHRHFAAKPPATKGRDRSWRSSFGKAISDVLFHKIMASLSAGVAVAAVIAGIPIAALIFLATAALSCIYLAWRAE